MAGIFLDFRVRSIWWRRSLSWPLAMPWYQRPKGLELPGQLRGW